jgi:hypothetical protein
MSNRSVALVFPSGYVRNITSRQARELRANKHADVLSENPYSLKLRAEVVQQYEKVEKVSGSGFASWSTCSDGHIMNGAVLMSRA